MYYDEEERKQNIEYNTPRQEKEYWIDTKGRIRKYKGPLDEHIVSMHYEIAIQEFPELEESNAPTDHLRDLGWIMMGSSYHQPVIYGKPTQKQLDTLMDIDPVKLDRLAIEKDGYLPLWKNVKHKF